MQSDRQRYVHLCMLRISNSFILVGSSHILKQSLFRRDCDLLFAEYDINGKRSLIFQVGRKWAQQQSRTDTISSQTRHQGTTRKFARPCCSYVTSQKNLPLRDVRMFRCVCRSKDSWATS